jgi:hypothetical protein
LALSPLTTYFCPVHGPDFTSDQQQDGHIDLAWLVRLEYGNNATAIDLDKPMPGEVDIPRLRAGHVGGFFWCVSPLPRPESRFFDRLLPLSLQVDLCAVSREQW